MDIEGRRRIKASAPKITLADEHTANCRVVPTRERMLELLPRDGVVAEVGVAFGDFTQEILKRNRPSKLHLVDLWAGERYGEGLARIERDLAPMIETGSVEINRGRSLEVLEQFPDAYFDWLYIDTDHSYQTTAAELETSRRKTKADGLIAGHDFCPGNVLTPWPYGVIEAVNEFCVKYDWEYLYLTLEYHGHLSFCLRAR